MTLMSSHMLKKTTEQFIEDAKLIHGDKFKYDLVEYNGVKNKIKIICSNNHIFEQSPNDHLNGHGCKKCSGWGEMKYDNDEFLKRIEQIHGLEIICDKTQYIDHNEKVILNCPQHGVFYKSPKDLLIKKQGCPKCGYKRASLKNKRSPNDFVDKADVIHGYFYNYSLVDYINAITKIKIICPKHGIFEQYPKDHINQSHGCPSCSFSKGERIISNILNEKEIKFIAQYSFDDCVNKNTKRKLFFDFYLPEWNVCIEFDGEQHFFPVNKFGGIKEFSYIKQRDEIKNEYCILNEIVLIRINYKQIKQIEEIIQKYVEHFK